VEGSWTEALERIHPEALGLMMNNPDQDTLVRAVEDARRVLGENPDRNTLAIDWRRLLPKVRASRLA
jgi:hypothetical protein